MNVATEQDSTAWYKQFWPWFLITLLLSSISMGLLFAYLAINGADPVIDKNYYQHGLDINKELAEKSQGKP
jgi:hypothetical protein